ncbi:fungal-specific transcription factor domain-containing protein [Mycena galopus ATCC 62051]|nr:fungal-specific transcription factor domain-containing protein [Mycena galopus ATCC 62051]
MSSNDEDDRPPRGPTKKRGHRPCDVCRRKKRRCDGGEPCDRCIKHESECTYQQKAMPRLAAQGSSYVNSLENRLKTVEGLLRESHMVSSPETPLEPTPEDSQAVGLITRAIRGLSKPFPAPHSEDLTFLEVAASLSSLSLNNQSNRGFQGKSSQAMLIKTAVELRSQTVPAPASRPVAQPPEKLWRMKPWETGPSCPNYIFPPEDLALRLVSLYFSNVNIFFPVLNRPIFEQGLASHMHLSEHGFARLLLLVCALGSRYSDDPRVHPDRSVGTAGWIWFDQMNLTVAAQPTLFDLQCYCLAVQFLDRTSGPRTAWTMAGIGIRLAQDIGAHRMKLRKDPISPEEEMEKRAYWTLVVFDAQLCSALGRSIAIQSHDFDLDFPLAVDDEYWEASSCNAAFSQPSNKPSMVDYLNCQLNLNRILSFTLKVFYSTSRSRSIIGVTDESWEMFVMEFDSALNTWRDSVPVHLRWNPGRTDDDMFFDQSAALWCNYYMTQILVQRPFIHSEFLRSVASKSFPSLTICNDAARAVGHVAEIHHQRRPNNPLVFGSTAVFTAGIVLLLNIWGGRRGGSVQDADFSDVHRCLGVLRAYNERWPAAGPLLDTLEQLLKVDHALSVGASPANYVPPLCGSDHSSGTAGGKSSSPPVSRDPSFGVPSSSVLTWPAYDPMLETFNHDGMMNTLYGPGEAPARAPLVGAGYTTDTTSFLNNVPHALSFTAGDSNHHGTGNTTAMHIDTVAIWSAAPSGFEVSDWDSYLTSIGT